MELVPLTNNKGYLETLLKLSKVEPNILSCYMQ